MGKKDVEALEITIDELPTYLHAKHSVYMEVADVTYYLTDVNDRYWRAQDTDQFNDKGHYVDAARSCPRSPSSWICRSTRENRSAIWLPRPPSTHPAMARTCPRISKRRRVFSEAVCLLFLRRSRTPRCRKDASGFVL